MKWIAIWGIVSIVSCLLAGLLAATKNRDHSSWMGWTFVLPPLVLVLLFLPRNPGPPPRRPTVDEEEQRSLTGQ